MTGQEDLADEFNLGETLPIKSDVVLNNSLGLASRTLGNLN